MGALLAAIEEDMEQHDDLTRDVLADRVGPCHREQCHLLAMAHLSRAEAEMADMLRSYPPQQRKRMMAAWLLKRARKLAQEAEQEDGGALAA